MNGQQLVEINGDSAKGKAYCTVTLVGVNAEGKTVRTTQGVWYEDEYKKIEGIWKIANRTSHFCYTDECEV